MHPREVAKLLGVSEKWTKSLMEPTELIDHINANGLHSLTSGNVRWPTVVNTLSALVELVERSTSLLGYHDIDPSGVPGCLPGCNRCIYEADVVSLFTHVEEEINDPAS